MFCEECNPNGKGSRPGFFVGLGFNGNPDPCRTCAGQPKPGFINIEDDVSLKKLSTQEVLGAHPPSLYPMPDPYTNINIAKNQIAFIQYGLLKNKQAESRAIDIALSKTLKGERVLYVSLENDLYKTQKRIQKAMNDTGKDWSNFNSLRICQEFEVLYKIKQFINNFDYLVLHSEQLSQANIDAMSFAIKKLKNIFLFSSTSRTNVNVRYASSIILELDGTLIKSKYQQAP